MKTTLDLTGTKSGCIDTEWAMLFFSPPRELHEPLIFEVWGLLLHTTSDFLEKRISVSGLSFDSELHNVFIAGFSRFVIHAPLCMEFEVAVYDPNQGKQNFLYDQEGNIVRFVKNYTSPPKNNTYVKNNTYEYFFGGMLNWPQGDCQLTVKASGSVMLEFMSEDCVTAEEFERNRRNYICSELG